MDELLVVCPVLNFPLNAGNLNISNLELKEIPEDVYSMYDLSTKSVVVDFSSKSSGWYDSVDLERFNASGNEISQIDELISEEFGGIKHFDVIWCAPLLLTCRCTPINSPPCLQNFNRSNFSEH
jgi:hypothetical protein